jgi:hypothetical protein
VSASSLARRALPLRALPRRVLRVAAGLGNPTKRSAYVDALRRELQRPAARTAQREACVVCGRKSAVVQSVTSLHPGRKRPAKTFNFRVCANCGHVANPENVHDYSKFPDLEALPLRARVGTHDRKGREFHMATMALDILGRSADVSVLIYGAGRSFDNHHIAALPQVSEVAVADIMQLRDDAPFYRCGEPAPRQFSIVVASEVVEHFLNPLDDFANLFSFVEDDGIIVCSTNLHDGRDLADVRYIFLPGHTQYYTERALELIAARHGFLADFRTPLVATGYGGATKRYILFSQSPSVMAATRDYFTTRKYAPSEGPWANKELRGTIAKERAAAKKRKEAAKVHAGSESTGP